jgi:chromosome segregation ATPase
MLLNAAFKPVEVGDSQKTEARDRERADACKTFLNAAAPHFQHAVESAVGDSQTLLKENRELQDSIDGLVKAVGATKAAYDAADADRVSLRRTLNRLSGETSALQEEAADLQRETEEVARMEPRANATAAENNAAYETMVRLQNEYTEQYSHWIRVLWGVIDNQPQHRADATSHMEYLKATGTLNPQKPSFFIGGPQVWSSSVRTQNEFHQRMLDGREQFNAISARNTAFYNDFTERKSAHDMRLREFERRQSKHIAAMADLPQLEAGIRADDKACEEAERKLNAHESKLAGEREKVREHNAKVDKFNKSLEILVEVAGGIAVAIATVRAIDPKAAASFQADFEKMLAAMEAKSS